MGEFEGNEENAFQFANELSLTASDASARASKLEKQFFGRAEGKTDRVSAQQVIERCQSLCQLNEVSMSLLEAHLRRFSTQMHETEADARVTSASTVQTGVGGMEDAVLAPAAKPLLDADVRHIDDAKDTAATMNGDDDDENVDEDEDETADVTVMSVQDFITTTESDVACATAGAGSAGSPALSTSSPMGAVAIPNSAASSCLNTPVAPQLATAPDSAVSSDQERTPSLDDFKITAATRHLVDKEKGPLGGVSHAATSLSHDLRSEAEFAMSASATTTTASVSVPMTVPVSPDTPPPVSMTSSRIHVQSSALPAPMHTSASSTPTPTFADASPLSPKMGGGDVSPVSLPYALQPASQAAQAAEAPFTPAAGSGSTAAAPSSGLSADTPDTPQMDLLTTALR